MVKTCPFENSLLFIMKYNFKDVVNSTNRVEVKMKFQIVHSENKQN